MKGFIEVTEMYEIFHGEEKSVWIDTSKELKDKEEERKALHNSGLDFCQFFLVVSSYHDDKKPNSDYIYKYNLWGNKKRFINVSKIVDITPSFRQYHNDNFKLVIGCDIRFFNNEHIYCQETYEEIKKKIEEAQGK